MLCAMPPTIRYCFLLSVFDLLCWESSHFMLSSYACEQSLVMWIEIIYSKDFDLLTLCSLYKKAMPDSSTMTTFGIPGTLLYLDRHVSLKVGGKLCFPASWLSIIYLCFTGMSLCHLSEFFVSCIQLCWKGSSSQTGTFCCPGTGGQPCEPGPGEGKWHLIWSMVLNPFLAQLVKKTKRGWSYIWQQWLDVQCKYSSICDLYNLKSPHNSTYINVHSSWNKYMWWMT